VGHSPLLHQQLISALHCSAIGGHSRIPVTYRRVKQTFAWKGFKQAVIEFVQNCQVCHQSKPDRTKYPGKLQPLPVTTEAWQTITMDFIKGLPRSRSADCILVVVDKFTRYAHFIPLSHPYTAQSVAAAFMSVVYKLHGL
jgi:hypothetical protein